MPGLTVWPQALAKHWAETQGACFDLVAAAAAAAHKDMHPHKLIQGGNHLSCRSSCHDIIEADNTEKT